MLATLALAAAISHLPASIRGDFDHDGKSDIAEVVAARNGSYRLVIRPGDPRQPVAIITTITGAELANFFIAKGRPGLYRTWCGKGGGSDKDPCLRKVVRLRGDTLTFGTEEASESVVLWNGKRFEVVLISD
jgi:hypothetical protein